jgi:hypothetical protein
MQDAPQTGTAGHHAPPGGAAGRDGQPGRAARRFGHPEVFALLAAASFLAARFLPLLALPYTCPSKGLLGIPCVTCGMTHAFVALAHGDLSGALHASPLGAALAAGAWLYALADLLRLALGRPFPDLPPRLLRAATALGLVALLANWAWLLARQA